VIVLEWIGAHLLGPFISLYRTVTTRPRPDFTIHELVPTGGGTNVDFQATVQNVGTQPARATITARVGDTPVHVITPIVDLLVNAPSTTVQIRVPRPDAGDLIPEMGNENATTLYGETLTVEVADAAGKHRQSETWREWVYSLEDNYTRHAIQQRVWRRGRGEETPDDLRDQLLSRHEQNVDDQ